jgi:polyhydroxyalkanoate synthesis repressor PhaR
VSAPTLIKKYGNRRLYDTGESRYITLDELSKKIQEGTDVRVVDAKTGADLTQSTLTQIIIEGRGVVRMLPVPLLMRLIRLGDDALAEFFGRYVSDALEIYLQMKRGASAVARYNPFASMPFAATDALARLWMGSGFGTGASRAGEPWSAPSAEEAEDGAMPEPSSIEGSGSPVEELALLRKELDELKRSMQREAEPPPRRTTRKRKPR